MSLLLEALKQAQKEKDRLNQVRAKLAEENGIASSPATSAATSRPFEPTPTPNLSAPTTPLSLSLSDDAAPLSAAAPAPAADFSNISLSLDEGNTPLAPKVDAPQTSDNTKLATNTKPNEFCPPENTTENTAFPNLNFSAPAANTAASPVAEQQDSPLPSLDFSAPAAPNNAPETTLAQPSALPQLNLSAPNNNDQTNDKTEASGGQNTDTTTENQKPSENSNDHTQHDTSGGQNPPTETPPNSNDALRSMFGSAAQNHAPKKEATPPNSSDTLRSMFGPAAQNYAPKKDTNVQNDETLNTPSETVNTTNAEEQIENATPSDTTEQSKKSLRDMFTPPSSPADKNEATPTNKSNTKTAEHEYKSDALLEMRRHAQRLLTATHTHKIDKVSPLIWLLAAMTALFLIGFAWYWWNTTQQHTPIITQRTRPLPTEETLAPLPEAVPETTAQEDLLAQLANQPLPDIDLSALSAPALPAATADAPTDAPTSINIPTSNTLPDLGTPPNQTVSDTLIAANPAKIAVYTASDGSKIYTNVRTQARRLRQQQGQTPVSPKKQRRRQAEQSFQRGDLASSAALWQDIVNDTPQDLDAQLGLASTLAYQGQTTEAMRIYREVQNSSTPFESAPHSAYGNRESPKAIAAFELGNQYAAQNQWEEAQKSYFEASSMAPNSPEFALNLAISLDRLHLSEQARDHYIRALNLSENMMPPPFARDAVQMRLEQLVQAIHETPHHATEEP